MKGRKIVRENIRKIELHTQRDKLFQQLKLSAEVQKEAELRTATRNLRTILLV